MTRYIVRRLVLLVPLLVGASILVFLTMRLIPGDPARLALGAEATEEQVQLMRRQWTTGWQRAAGKKTRSTEL